MIVELDRPKAYSEPRVFLPLYLSRRARYLSSFASLSLSPLSLSRSLSPRRDHPQCQNWAVTIQRIHKVFPVSRGRFGIMSIISLPLDDSPSRTGYVEGTEGGHVTILSVTWPPSGSKLGRDTTTHSKLFSGRERRRKVRITQLIPRSFQSRRCVPGTPRFPATVGTNEQGEWIP